jgi:hypothetical protein
LTKLIFGEVFANSLIHNDYAHLSNLTEEVIDKPEIASKIGDQYSWMPKTDLAEVLYGNHILTGVSSANGVPA